MLMPAPKPHWETLPAEICLSILKQLPDLTALRNFLIASPAASRIFDTYAADIFEAHLASGTLHHYSCALIRLSAYLRSGIIPAGVSSLKDFTNLCMHETTGNRYEPPKWTLPPLRLLQPSGAAAVSASVLRGVLASHHRNEQLAIGCLNTYLRRFRALEPRHVVDPGFIFTTEAPGPDGSEYLGAWRMQPETALFPKRDVGPPTWCEEQRMFRAAWRVEVFKDLKAAAAAGHLSNWAADDHKMLQIYTAANWLYNDATTLIGGLLGDPSPLMQFIDVEHELVYTMLDYLEGIEAAVGNVVFPTSRTWPVPVPSQQDVLEVEDYTSAMALVFQRVHWEENGHIYSTIVSPLQHVPWDYYRRRGFAIWCEARMVGYGLVFTQFCLPDVAATNDSDWSLGSIWMAWKSVLTEEELAFVDQVNERFQAEGLEGRLYNPYMSYLNRNVTPDIYRTSPFDR